jgi:hypothetical protein
VWTESVIRGILEMTATAQVLFFDVTQSIPHVVFQQIQLASKRVLLLYCGIVIVVRLLQCYEKNIWTEER